MASILDKFGIKEVGDVTFYHLTSNGTPDYPVLYLDTCKVTSLEQTADEVEAKGGKGNVSLMVWDTNKQLTVNLEDALFSTKSMAIMFGNGTAAAYNTSSTDKAAGEVGTANSKYIMKTEQFTSTALTGTPAVLPAQWDEDETGGKTAPGLQGGWDWGYTAPDGKKYVKRNPKFYDENGTLLTANTWTSGKTYFCSYDLAVDGAVISIDKDSFPGSYYVTIDTYARMQGSGADDFFQLIMPNCKVQSSNTISMSADGDPSTLTMNLKVQKPANGGAMVYMVKYGISSTAHDAAVSSGNFSHNHNMVAAQG